MKKTIILILLVLLGSLSGCQKNRVEDDYPMLNGINHVFEKSTYQEVTKALTVASGVQVVLFSYNPHFYECPFCLAVMPIINDAALKMGIEKILYLDIYEMRKNNTTEYQLLLGYLDNKVGDLIVRDGVKKLIVPDLYVVKDGEIAAHHIATLKNDKGAF
nr:hypothetical protein [Bacilli bacterium]